MAWIRRIRSTGPRIGGIPQDGVKVRCKDQRAHDCWKALCRAGEELIPQFLHVLPKGLMLTRHYRFLANRCRKETLAKIGQVLGQVAEEVVADPSTEACRWGAAVGGW